MQNEQDGQMKIEYLKTVGLAVAFFIIAPLTYFVIASQAIAIDDKGVGEHLVFYILLSVAIVSPPLSLFVSRVQVSHLMANRKSTGDLMKQMTAIWIVKFAFVESVYIYGLITAMVTGELELMLWFYPIGVFWTIIHWPTKTRWRRLIETPEKP